MDICEYCGANLRKLGKTWHAYQSGPICPTDGLEHKPLIRDAWRPFAQYPAA